MKNITHSWPLDLASLDMPLVMTDPWLINLANIDEVQKQNTLQNNKQQQRAAFQSSTKKVRAVCEIVKGLSKSRKGFKMFT